MEKLKLVFNRYRDGVGYNEEAKFQFGKTAQSYLKKLSEALGATDRKISWNKGGIAVSGDVTLKAMLTPEKGVYIDISHPCQHGIMFRSITSLKDHKGGKNEWFTIEQFKNYQDLANHIRRMINEDRTQSN